MPKSIHIFYTKSLFTVIYSLLLISVVACDGPKHLAEADPKLIERVEPPNWWSGMQDQNLQLMLRGENLQQYRWSVKAVNAKLMSTHEADNPNYVFMDLDLQDEPAGEIQICYEAIGPTSAKESNQMCIAYPIRERSASSAGRQGFDQTDVLYLITPDRFANGDPSNDELIGYPDTLNRNEDYGRHGGDIKGIIDRLDYIKDMGFTAVWLNPVLENNMPHASYHGYATTDYYKVDPRFGSNEEYRDLCHIADEKGIKIIMDMIANHCGSLHWWMDDLPFDDWLNYQGEEYQNTNHRKSTLLDPYVSALDRKEMVDGWFVPTMPDLNQRNPFMAKYLIQNSIWWIEYSGITGIRQDTYSYPDRNFMSDWTCAIQREYPNFSIVGEEWTDDPATVAYWQQDKVNGDGYSSCLKSQMDFPFCMKMHEALRNEEEWGKGLIELYTTLAQDFHYSHPEDLVIFPDNHDMSRIFTQVGEDYELFRMACVLSATMRGIPQFYYGTEILMANPGTESHGVIRSDFPGGWDADVEDAFDLDADADVLSTHARSREAQAFLRELLHWRASRPVVHHGKLMHFVPKDGVYVYFRYDETDMVMVVLNKGEQQSLDLMRFSEILPQGAMLQDALGAKIQGDAMSISLAAKSVYVIDVKK